MQDAYIFTKWKLFGLLLLSALFGVVVGGQARAWRSR
jgi:hypothetical protein